MTTRKGPLKVYKEVENVSSLTIGEDSRRDKSRKSSSRGSNRGTKVTVNYEDVFRTLKVVKMPRDTKVSETHF